MSKNNISRFTENYLRNTKVRKGDFDWDLYNMKEELTDEQHYHIVFPSSDPQRLAL